MKQPLPCKVNNDDGEDAVNSADLTVNGNNQISAIVAGRNKSGGKRTAVQTVCEAHGFPYGPESVSIRKNILRALAGTGMDVVPSPAESV